MPKVQLHKRDKQSQYWQALAYLRGKRSKPVRAVPLPGWHSHNWL